MTSLWTWYPDIVWEVERGEEPDIGGLEEACEEIHEAMEGWGTDENTLTQVLGSKTAEERYIISKQYPELFEESLYDQIDDETGGDYGRAMKLLALDPVQCEARMVYNAMKGLGAREKHLIPLIVARSNYDMTLLKRAYYEMYEEDMVIALSENLDDDFEKLITMCAQGIEDNYDPEEVHTEDKIMEDVDAFYEAGQGSWGTDDSVFFKLLVDSPSEHLQAMNMAYVEKYGYSITKAVEKETGGDTEDALLFLVGIKLEHKTAQTMAKEIKSTTSGLGADETGLLNLIIRLSVHSNLFQEVLSAHEELFEKTVEDRIEDEIGGDLKDLLLLLVEKCKE